MLRVTPLGYGRSDRVPDNAGEALVDQIVAILDHHGIDRFAIWGHSAGGAPAALLRGPDSSGLAVGPDR